MNTVGFPAEQTCCGQPHFNSGFHQDARDLARHTIRVFDNGVPSLNATQSFTITVNEVNVAPVLNNLSNTVWTINELTSITLTNKATDADLPTNILTYAIVSAPSGATLDPVSGKLTTPELAAQTTPS